MLFSVIRVSSDKPVFNSVFVGGENKIVSTV